MGEEDSEDTGRKGHQLLWVGGRRLEAQSQGGEWVLREGGLPSTEGRGRYICMFSGRKFSSDIVFSLTKGEHPRSRGEAPEAAGKGLSVQAPLSFHMPLTSAESSESELGTAWARSPALLPRDPGAAEWLLHDSGLPRP